jgi:AraC-like DNA-binding protein
VFESKTLRAQSSQTPQATSTESSMDIESLGLVLDDPSGYLRSDQMRLGQGEAIIGRICSTGYTGRLREETYFTFVLQQAGRYDVQISGRDYGMSSGSLLAFRPNERLTQVRPGKTGIRTCTTLQVPVAKINELAQAMEISNVVAFPRDGIALREEGGLTLGRILPQLADDLFLRPSAVLPQRVVLAITQLVDEQLSAMFAHNASISVTRRIFPAFHRVRQAEEFFHEHSDDPLSMLDVAKGLGVSLRSLQMAFNEVYQGLGPRDVLTKIRLEKARQRLLSADADVQVTKVAFDSGFFHLGRFAQSYARHFGQRPSETLARRRA